MQQLILKKDIEKSKIDALLHFLKSWDIKTEFISTKTVITKKKSTFSLSAGRWKDYAIDANELRKKTH